MEPLMLGVLAGLAIAIPVGAIAVLIVQTGVRRGFRCAASAGAGAATADLVYAALAVTGGATLAASVASIETPLRWVSAAILMVIAVSGLRQAPLSPSPHLQPNDQMGSGCARTYSRFLALTIVNPLTVVYFATIVVGSGLATGLTALQGATFALGAFLASLSWQTLLAATGGLARDRLPRRFHTGVSRAGNLLILGLAVLVIV